MKGITPIADLDGLTGDGGCEYCNADFEVAIDGNGFTRINVRHDDGCPMIGHSELMMGDPSVLDAAMRSVLDRQTRPNRAQRRANKKKGK